MKYLWEIEVKLSCGTAYENESNGSCYSGVNINGTLHKLPTIKHTIDNFFISVVNILTLMGLKVKMNI